MPKGVIPYEQISNLDPTKAFNKAEDIIQNGWTIGNHSLTCLKDDIPWRLKSHDERSWNFHIHCWDMLDSLLMAHSETGDNKYLKPAVDIAFDWYEKQRVLPDSEISPFAWYDMAVGMRAYRLAYIIDAANDVGLLDANNRDALLQSLELHRAYLADDANIAFHNNHGYYQVVGQLAMGRRFATTSIEMAQAWEQGRERLRRMLRQQFAEDGVHREHSPDYHRMVYETLRDLIDSGLIDDTEIISFAKKIEESLAWFVLPNQYIANFGDSDYRLLRLKPVEAERKWKTLAMRYMVSGGKVGELPRQTVAAFSDSGYFVIRKPAENKLNDVSRFSYLAQTAAFHSRTHKHADDLSFIWSDRGSDILVDAGRYGYIGKVKRGSDLWKQGYWYSDPNRIYCESTRAHNTLEFDSKNYPRRGVKPFGSALKRWVEDASGVVAVETECVHFGGIIGGIHQSRLLIFLPGKWLLVFDWFNDRLLQRHAVKQWFHLAPHLQLHRVDAGYLVPIHTSTQPLRIISLLQEPQPSRLYIGEEKPVMQGWWSPKGLEIVPNYSFCYQLTRARNGAFATLFSFSENLSADKNYSKVNTSGRKGQLRWSDDLGIHQVCFSRDTKDDMVLAYTCE